MKDMTIGIIGNGTVGQATARAYLEHVKEVRCVDVDPRRCTHQMTMVLAADIIFVCLPTPQDDPMYAVREFFRDLPADARGCNFVLRSTVPIGTTRRLREEFNLPNLVHSPEFLTARCALVDAQMPSRNVIGAPDGRPSECDGALLELYCTRWPHVPVVALTSDESEAVKLFQNAFFAVKVSIWNELRAFADERKLDWDRVMQAILADGRIHPSHTNVPGPDGQRGFGGACLPKDLAALIAQMDDAKLQHGVCRAAQDRNDYLDRPKGA